MTKMVIKWDKWPLWARLIWPFVFLYYIIFGVLSRLFEKTGIHINVDNTLLHKFLHWYDIKTGVTRLDYFNEEESDDSQQEV